MRKNIKDIKKKKIQNPVQKRQSFIFIFIKGAVMRWRFSENIKFVPGILIWSGSFRSDNKNMKI